MNMLGHRSAGHGWAEVPPVRSASAESVRAIRWPVLGRWSVPTSLQAGLWALFAASSLPLGAFVAERFAVPRARVGQVMGFGAGALIAALAYELIPDAHISDWQIWLSFGTGALFFYGADSILERRMGGGDGAGLAIALGALLDGIPESIVLGVGFAVGGSISVGFLAAVFVSNVPESLSSTAELKTTYSPARIYKLWTAIALISGVAATLGCAVASHQSAVDGRYIQA